MIGSEYSVRKVWVQNQRSKITIIFGASVFHTVNVLQLRLPTEEVAQTAELIEEPLTKNICDNE